MTCKKMGAIVGALFMTLLAGCATVEEDDGIVELTLNISVSEGVNPDKSGRPSPIFLQVHELRDASTFNNSRYLDVYRDARGTLGSTYVATYEFGPLYPGSEVQKVIRLSPTSVAIGVLGEFNRYQETEHTMLRIEFTPGEDSSASFIINAAGLKNAASLEP
ncbi:MAG: type VI secretion system protein VasD [Halieaceae bacterium]|jgi:type VI secretion system protein VasD